MQENIPGGAFDAGHGERAIKAHDFALIVAVNAPPGHYFSFLIHWLEGQVIAVVRPLIGRPGGWCGGLLLPGE